MLHSSLARENAQIVWRTGFESSKKVKAKRSLMGYLRPKQKAFLGSPSCLEATLKVHYFGIAWRRETKDLGEN